MPRIPISEFSNLVKRYRNQILRYAFKITNDRELAEDLVQTALVYVYLNFNEWKQVKYFEGWVCKKVFHLYLNHKEKLSNKPMISLEEVGCPDADNPSPYLDILIAKDMIRDVEDKIHLESFFKKNRAGVNQKHLSYFIMYKLLAQKSSDISTYYGVPEGTIKSNCNKLQKTLRPMWKAYTNDQV